MELQVGVKIILQNKEGKYLLLKRNPEKYPETGAKWDIVGGRINIGSSLLENLKREVFEETGLGINSDPKLIAAQDILKIDKHVVRLTYTGFTEVEVKLSEEHSDFKWISREDVKTLDPIDSYTKSVFDTFLN